MKRPEETMRALSREELEQMLQNDFLMASSCDAEQVVQVVEELMAREGQSEAVRRARTSASLEAFWKRYEGERGAAGKMRPRRRRKRGWMAAAVLAALLAAAVLPAAGHEGMFQVHSPWQTEDSPQIAGETLEVQVEEAGRMTIRYFIAGKGQVEALGAEEIVIRHKVGGVWMETVRYDRKTDELWTEGTMEYGGEISYQGRPGERYQVEVLFFAENEAGYDSRRQTWEVTAE